MRVARQIAPTAVQAAAKLAKMPTVDSPFAIQPVAAGNVPVEPQNRQEFLIQVVVVAVEMQKEMVAEVVLATTAEAEVSSVVEAEVQDISIEA